MEQLKIYQKIYDMIVYGNNCLLQFPRSERYALATEIKKTMYTLLRLAIAANKKYYKKTTLQEMDVELETLKTFIRVAADPKFKYLGLKQYENWSKMLSEIGRMQEEGRTAEEILLEYPALTEDEKTEILAAL